MTSLHIDFETSSAAELAGDDAVGVSKYAEHWTTRVFMMAYRFDEGEKKIWFMWEPFPQEVVDHVASGGVVIAHNAGFERTMWNVVLRRPNAVNNYPALDLPELKINQMVCTLARASALALPAGLDFVAQVLGFENRKDPVGGALMKKYCKPATRTLHADGSETYTWHDVREDYLRIGEYCLQDVEVETDTDKAVLHHMPRERRVWELDQLINSRGVRLDLKAVRAAVEVINYAKPSLNIRMAELTGGVVRKCTEAGKLVQWINSRGVECSSIAKEVQDDICLQAQIVDPDIIEAIELRNYSAGGKGSPTSKYQTMLDCLCADGKARDQLFYHGATTGRWAGRLIQFQNMPTIDEERDLPNVVAAMAILGMPWTPAEKSLAIELLCGSVLPILAKCLRHMLIASEGNRLIGGDLSNIEGCVAAWVSGEDWKIQAYLDYQRGVGHDLYKVAYSRAFGVAVEQVTKAQRAVGKIMELALGFGGSLGALVKMCRKFGIKIATMVAPIKESASEEAWEAARRKRSRPGVKLFGISEDEWIALRVAVDLWRSAHPNLTSSWWQIQDAAIDAVANPGTRVDILGGKCAYVYAKGVLWCRLPSGRKLAYHKPRIKTSSEFQLIDDDGNTAWISEADVPSLLKKGLRRTEAEPRVKRNLFYEGYDNTKKRWGLQSLYFGNEYENVVQSVARDVMVEWMFLAEAAGYPLVLTVHDELLTDVPLGHGSAEHLRQLIVNANVEWWAGLPLEAKCWEDVRYAK